MPESGQSGQFQSGPSQPEVRVMSESCLPREVTNLSQLSPVSQAVATVSESTILARQPWFLLCASGLSHSAAAVAALTLR
jgi:hypothetical protein